MSRAWGVAVSSVLILAACAMFRSGEEETLEAKAPPAPVEITVVPPAVESSPVLIDDEFELLLTEVRDQLPTRAILRNKTAEEVHQPPQELLDIGLEFGKIHDALALQPSRVPAGAAFFAECAGRDDLLTSVRAVCVRNARFWGVTVDGLPAEVERVAAALPVLKR